MRKPLLSALLAVCTCFAVNAQSVTFDIASLNVDGLPKSILGVNINPDGMEGDGARALADMIITNRANWDVIALQEDFNFHDDLITALGDGYSSGSHGGSVSVSAITGAKTDGLGILWKKDGKATVSGEVKEPWNTSAGAIPDGNDGQYDELIHKGFRYYILDFGDGLQVDFYTHHMDAGTRTADNAARADNVKQLVDYIKNHDNGRPIIVMGDSNCRYTRDDVESMVFGELNATGYLQVRDPWVDKYWNGIIPALGTSTLDTGAYGLQRGEVVDKMWYINNKHANGVKITVEEFGQDTEFAEFNNETWRWEFPYSDHFPIQATVKIEKIANADEVFVPDPVVPNDYYIRSVATGEFLTGGGTYGTKSTMHNSGETFKLQQNPDGEGFFLDSSFGRVKYDGTEIFVDGAMDGTDTQQVIWNVEKFTDDTYAFRYSDNMYMSVEPDTNPEWFSDYPLNFAEMKEGEIDKSNFKELSELLSKYLFRLYTEDELTAELAGIASREHPQDLSYKIVGAKIQRNNSHNNIWGENFKYECTHDYTTRQWFTTTQHNDILAAQQYWGNGAWNDNNHVQRFYTSVPNNTGGTNRTKASLWNCEQTIENIPNGIYQLSGNMLRLHIDADGVKCLVNGESIGTITEYDDAAGEYATADFNTESMAPKLAENYFNNKYYISHEFVVTNNKLTIRFEKTQEIDARTYMAFCNLTLLYLGQTHPEGTEQPRQEISLEFPENDYTTLILPFDAECPENLIVYEALSISDEMEEGKDGETYEYHKVALSDAINSISANYPYVARLVKEDSGKKAPARSATRAASGSQMIIFQGYATNKVHQYTDNQQVLTGVLRDTKVDAGHYTMVQSDMLNAIFNESATVATVPQYRAYISAVSQPNTTHSRILFEDSPNILTGVESVATDVEDANEPVDVYTVSGVMLRAKVTKQEALTDLPSGIYILRSASAAHKVAK